MTGQQKQRLCEVEGCGRFSIARSMCMKHYQRVRLYGDVHRSKKVLIRGIDDIEGIKASLLRKVDVDPESGCWVWRRKDAKVMYPKVTIGRAERKDWAAHRLSAMVFNGYDINAETLICHRCDNPRCINPAHLFEGTHRDNVLDMISKKRGNFQRRQARRLGLESAPMV